MALSSMTATISNDRFKGGIVIGCTAVAQTLTNIDKLKLYRYISASNMTLIFSKSIAQVSDLTFSVMDIGCVCGTEYNYKIELTYMVGDVETITESQVYEHKVCEFDGLLIADLARNKYYIAVGNFKTEYNPNTECEYVTTLGNKYPFRVANGTMNYCTGTSNGLFMQYDFVNHEFIVDKYHVYSDEVLNFLNDGNNKILKTHDGHIWNVGISNPKKSYTGYYGDNPIDFSWTELGEVPALCTVTP